ncbi:MAG: hypothetical protein Q8P51_08030 [Ignavibacteria bacterium]|nr:hypothetical protein [Ignavibacteria bacterium]
MPFFSKLFGKGSAVDTADYYSIVFKATGVSVTLEVNGQQVMQDDYEFGGAGSRPVNEWTKKGANTLTVKLRPLKKGSDDFMKYELLFSKDRKGQMAGDGEKLWDFLWESDSSPEKLPLQKTFEFTI